MAETLERILGKLAVATIGRPAVLEDPDQAGHSITAFCREHNCSLSEAEEFFLRRALKRFSADQADPEERAGTHRLPGRWTTRDILNRYKR
jgi:hypothetical protein